MYNSVSDIVRNYVYIKAFIVEHRELTIERLMMLLYVYNEGRRIDLKSLVRVFDCSEQMLVRLKKILIELGYMEDNYNMIISDKGLRLIDEFKKGLRG